MASSGFTRTLDNLGTAPTIILGVIMGLILTTAVIVPFLIIDITKEPNATVGLSKTAEGVQFTWIEMENGEYADGIEIVHNGTTVGKLSKHGHVIVIPHEKMVPGGNYQVIVNYEGNSKVVREFIYRR